MKSYKIPVTIEISTAIYAHNEREYKRKLNELLESLDQMENTEVIAEDFGGVDDLQTWEAKK
jgi:hypothetical protein